MFDSWKKKKMEQMIVEFHNERQLEDFRALMKKNLKGLYRDDVLDFKDYQAVVFDIDFKEDVRIIARGLTICGDAQVQVGDIECSQYIEVYNDSKLYAGDISCKNLEVGHRSYLEAKNIEVDYVKGSVPVEIWGSINANDIKINFNGIRFYGEPDKPCECTFNNIISKGDIIVSDGNLKANDIISTRDIIFSDGNLKANDIKTNQNINLSSTNVNVRDVDAGGIEGYGGTFTARDINIKEIRGWLNITARDITGRHDPVLEAGDVKARTIQALDGFFWRYKSR